MTKNGNRIIAAVILVALMFCTAGCEAEQAENTGSGQSEPQSIQENDLYHLGETFAVQEIGFKMEYTVNNVQVFDSGRKSGIKEEDFARGASRYMDNPLILVDITVKNVIEYESHEPYDVTGFELVNREILPKLWNEQMAMLFYHKDPDPENDTLSYYEIDIPEGESRDITIGFLITNLNYKAESLLLHVGQGLNYTDFVDLGV